MLEVVTFDEHLVENENLYDDGDSSEDESQTSRYTGGKLVTKTIGNIERDRQEEDSDGESDDDSSEDDEEEEGDSPTFQKFEVGKLRIRTMERPDSRQRQRQQSQNQNQRSEREDRARLPDCQTTNVACCQTATCQAAKLPDRLIALLYREGVCLISAEERHSLLFMKKECASLR